MNFTNEQLLCISGTKLDNCTSLALDGWTILVKDSTGATVGQNVTANGGKWQVCGLLPGKYTVSEVLKPNWKNVTALNQNVTLGCDNQTGIDFYNDPLVCISGTKFNNCTKLGLDGWTHISQRLDRSYCKPECHSQRRQMAGLRPASRQYTVSEVLKPNWKNRDSPEPECDPGLRQQDRH